MEGVSKSIFPPSTCIVFDHACEQSLPMSRWRLQGRSRVQWRLRSRSCRMRLPAWASRGGLGAAARLPMHNHLASRWRPRGRRRSTDGSASPAYTSFNLHFSCMHDFFASPHIVGTALMAVSHTGGTALEACRAGVTACVSDVGPRVAWRRMRCAGPGEGLEV